MNDDYAHLLGGAVLDYERLGKALKAVIRARGVTLADVENQTRVARPSVSRATAGVKIGTGPLLLLCIWADLNPFELLRPPSAVRDSTAKVFHGKQVLKLSENKEEFAGAAHG